MSYFILKPRADDDDVFIDALPENGPADWRFAEGEPLGKEFPKKATVKYSDNFPDGRVLADFVNNISDVLIVSSRVRTAFEKAGVPNVEYLPITILDHRGRVAGKDYYIANVLSSEPAIDMRKSDVIVGDLDDQITAINQLVIDKKAVSPDAKLFRATTMRTLFLIREDALEALQSCGAEGYKTYPADGWDGLDI